MSQRNSRRASFACVYFALSPLFANAHHGGAVEWQTQIAGPVTGVATGFDFRFPHVVVSMEVTTPSGTENWSITSRWTPTILRKLGWNRNSVAAGDEVVITYLPHVSAPTVGHMQTIVVNGKALALQD